MDLRDAIWALALPTLLAPTLLALGACGQSTSPPSCPPADKPATFGRSCLADGECGGYLVCHDEACAYPAAMTGDEDRRDATRVELFGGGEILRSIPVELAISDYERRQGLAHRPCIQPGWGMLFVHPHQDYRQYTVADMRFPIDLVFAAGDGQVVATYANLQPGDDRLVESGEAAKYALELPAGTLEAMEAAPERLRTGGH